MKTSRTDEEEALLYIYIDYPLPTLSPDHSAGLCFGLGAAGSGNASGTETQSSFTFWCFVQISEGHECFSGNTNAQLWQIGSFWCRLCQREWRAASQSTRVMSGPTSPSPHSRLPDVPQYIRGVAPVNESSGRLLASHTVASVTEGVWVGGGFWILNSVALRHLPFSLPTTSYITAFTVSAHQSAEETDNNNINKTNNNRKQVHDGSH